MSIMTMLLMLTLKMMMIIIFKIFLLKKASKINREKEDKSKLIKIAIRKLLGY